ncbi:sporulation-specific diadenylate cyclase CdaS [Metabacillus endolithicus]|uniref:Diadenylate cyclase n=1 Tax=Metabacillus endolithicus TaxID=1535204 RepID=A0ABW5BZH2_9BACI|nr:sporulation-specific diadenylate cyclase CdaS [Metabacillus endolithicus]UPG64171.1 sporulation-specific diadenylate cyclase CdaS [Metabacillus endolithicus]
MENEHNTFSSIKHHISFHLEQIIEEAEKMRLSIGEKEYCLLCELAQIKDRFNEIQSTASFFYLKAYIAEFTSQYIEIAKAIQNLSERRHGALIVVERNQNVDHLIQEGIQLNATLSNRLIESIFYPGNPLHDGAVLIKGDYMISAANVLPLSSQNFGQEKVGTRHRAAIGLSELTDALILIVSEETGKMSFALEGTLYPISTPDSNLQ